MKYSHHLMIRRLTKWDTPLHIKWNLAQTSTLIVTMFLLVAILICC